MFNSLLQLVTGEIKSITPLQGCLYSVFAITKSNETVNIIISSYTYIVDTIQLSPGMHIGVFYNASLPVTTQYPPTYQAIVVTVLAAYEFVLISYFDSELVAADQSIKLNIAPTTELVTMNGQKYHCDVFDHVLMVYMTSAVAGLLPQATPSKIIVLG